MSMLYRFLLYFWNQISSHIIFYWKMFIAPEEYLELTDRLAVYRRKWEDKEEEMEKFKEKCTKLEEKVKLLEEELKKK